MSPVEIIRAEGLGYKYHDTDEEGLWGAFEIDLSIAEEFVAVLEPKRFRKIHPGQTF